MFCTPHLHRHTLASEPYFFRKELHFFDQDHRYVRGLPFYAAHFPTCARDDGRRRPYLTSPPQHGVEIVLQDSRTGHTIGWDAELNIVTTTPSSFLLLPTVAGSLKTGSPASVAGSDKTGGTASYSLVDATSGRTLYLHGGSQLAMSDLSQSAEPPTSFRLRMGSGRTVDIESAFATSSRRLRWTNQSMRVEPSAPHGEGAWRVRRRVSDLPPTPL
jgi:hypothetical protein